MKIDNRLPAGKAGKLKIMHNKYSFLTKPTLSQKISPYLKWIIILILVIALVFGLKSYVNSVYQKEMQKNSKNLEEIKNNFRQSVKDSKRTSADLVKLGVKVLNYNQTEWAAIIFEEAAAKDPKYRDAAFYAGYANLRLAEEDKNSKSQAPNNSQYNKLAIEYLEKAKELDPIYPKTYELLTVAYKNIGDDENSKLCYNKYTEFNKQ